MAGCRPHSTEGLVLLTPVLVLLQTAFALPPATPAGAVSGTVRDGTAQRPLADVAVTEAGEVAALSDSAGRYRLDRLASGPHQLRFVRDGYDTLAVGVLLPDSGGARGPQLLPHEAHNLRPC